MRGRRPPPADRLGGKQAEGESGAVYEAGDDHHRQGDLEEPLERTAWWRPAGVAAVDIVRPILRTRHAHRPDRTRLAAVVLTALDAAELGLR
jgi:hypothetical protein